VGLRFSQRDALAFALLRMTMWVGYIDFEILPKGCISIHFVQNDSIKKIWESEEKRIDARLKLRRLTDGYDNVGWRFSQRDALAFTSFRMTI